MAAGSQTNFTETDTLVIHASVSQLKSLELADGELRDVILAIGHVVDCLCEMGREYDGNTDEKSMLFGQVCREAGVDVD